MNDLRLENIRKSYGATVALPDLSLDVKQGELMALLGPSGCGKTTTLRIIAGFEAIDRGRVMIGGSDVTRQPARLRNIGVVFQNYALFPHLTVAENVGFGLKMRGETKAKTSAAVADALALVQLKGLHDRLPRQLSGGQQQRVALARALAIQPRLLLLDEPLSNLDARLRDDLREEIRRVQRLVGITTIFVTHDQSEALAMADRIVVMRDGAIMQTGTPSDIYRRPASPFVASFIGRAAMLQGRVSTVNGGLARFETASGLSVIGESQHAVVGSNVVGVIRTERIGIGNAAPPGADNILTASVESTTYLGAAIRVVCALAGERIEVMQAVAPDREPPRAGDQVVLSWNTADCTVLPNPGEAECTAM